MSCNDGIRVLPRVKRKACRPAVERGMVFEKKLAAIAATDLAGIAELTSVGCFHSHVFLYTRKLQSCRPDPFH